VVTRIQRIVGVACGVAACVPSLSDQTTSVAAPRLLAVQAEPPEAPTGAPFSMTALYVGPDGPESPSSIQWAICTLQNPLDQSGPINPACFQAASTGLLALGSGATVKGTLPQDACELFGPESAPPPPGQPAARPTAPDTTGGFYLPVRLDLGAGQWSSASERIACQPVGVSQAVFVQFSNGYQLNANPTVSALSFADTDGGLTRIDGSAPGSPPVVSGGQHVSLEVEWPSCPATPVCGDGICSAGETVTACPKDCTTPKGCGGAEPYLYIDPTSRQVTTRRETMSASFYATGGTFDDDSVGRDEDDPATDVVDGWTAPSAAGPVHLWVVLRDSRGGIGWSSATITVQP
jgi:hypothetical protein